MQTGRWRVWTVAVTTVLVQARPGVLSAADGPSLSAKSAIIVDARSGSVIWAQNPDEQLPPASTTKVMTAILALESGRLRDQVEASPEACMVAPSKVNLRPGQRLILEDLVYAILLNSANDASIAIAEHLAPSVEAFGERMTARAKLLGATRTRFANPHGLTQDGHYSTVRDLATIFRYALAVPKFREIIGTKAVVVGVENSTRRIALRSHNRLLENYRIPVIGKTGYTLAAKKCFVGSGRYGEREVIVALMGSQDLWGDTRRLLEFGFGDDLPPESDRLRKKQHAGNRAPQGARPAATVGGKAQRAPQYAIHVGTFDRKDRAERLGRALGRRGFDVSVDRLAAGRGQQRRIRYRVEVGPYQNRGQAESAARTMASQVDLPTRIVQR
ncbi:MAG: D-alanyl-D-alanine carboxypeptidase [Dehalococcoidia bacterium]|nr:D-alanyl-D-alanine carboxypeptidase [Dehalococcoidia bacterium]